MTENRHIHAGNLKCHVFSSKAELYKNFFNLAEQSIALNFFTVLSKKSTLLSVGTLSGAEFWCSSDLVPGSVGFTVAFKDES